MPALQVDSLSFAFKANVRAEIYDVWNHYTSVWNAPPASQKAVDVVAVEGVSPESTTWLIEAKDFRVLTNPPKPSNLGGLHQSVAAKAAHTLAGLADASANAASLSEKSHATDALAAATRRVVLHLEPYGGADSNLSKLFPTRFAADVLQKLRPLVKEIDPNPLVLNIANTPAVGVPWIVS